MDIRICSRPHGRYDIQKGLVKKINKNNRKPGLAHAQPFFECQEIFYSKMYASMDRGGEYVMDPGLVRTEERRVRTSH